MENHLKKKTNLRETIDKELANFFTINKYSLEDELILENEIILSELLDPPDYYSYEGSKGFYTYYDNDGNKFFVRLVYQPIGSNPYFELKTGWFDEEGKAKYEPSIPPYSSKASGIYLQKRSNTVAKIFRDEIIPFFGNQSLSNTIVIRPVSASRARFSKMMINKFVPKNKFDVDLEDLTIKKLIK